MPVMIRRSVVSVVALLLLAAATVAAQETLRITPFINENRVVVSFELNDAYNDGVREAIASGLRTTFTYELQLRTPAWIDRTVGTTVVATTDQYDNLTRRHTLTRTIDGDGDRSDARLRQSRSAALKRGERRSSCSHLG